MQYHLQSCGELRVQRLPVDPTEQTQSFQPRWHVRRRVGVNRAAATVVTRVECAEQIDHFGAPALANDQPVRTHPKRLPDQVPQRYSTRTLDIGRPALQRHNVGVGRSQLGCVFHDDDAFIRRNQAQQRG